MAEPTKTSPTPSTPAAPARANEIAVRVIKFLPSAFIELPGSAGNSSITSRVGGDIRRAGHVVTYVPQMRHHRLEYYKANAEQPDSTHFVHEVHVGSWEAA